MSTFDESKIRRDGEGKFASKCPAAEASGVELEDLYGVSYDDPAEPEGEAPEPVETDPVVRSAKHAAAAFARDPVRDKGRDRTAHRQIVAQAIYPGLTREEADEVAHKMSLKATNHVKVHREANELSTARLNQTGVEGDRARYNGQIRLLVANRHLATEGIREDPRTYEAIIAMTPHLNDDARERSWQRAIELEDRITHVARTARPRFSDESDRQVGMAMGMADYHTARMHAGNPAFSHGITARLS